MTVERVLKILVQISYLFFFQESELQGFECYVKRSLWSGGNLTRRRDIFQNQVVCDFLICYLFVDAEQASCHQLSFCFMIYVSVVQQSFYPFIFLSFYFLSFLFFIYLYSQEVINM